MKPSSLAKPKKFAKDLTSPAALAELMRPGGPAAVIDFWAPWCAPCKAMAPTFEAVAEVFADQPVQFLKLNTEAHPHLAAPFNVRSIPTMVFVNDGEIVDVVVGALPRSRLADKVEWLLSKARGESFFTRLFGARKARPEQGRD